MVPDWVNLSQTSYRRAYMLLSQRNASIPAAAVVVLYYYNSSTGGSTQI